MKSVPRSFSGHGPAHGRLVEVVTADFRVLVDQYGNRETVALLERGVAIDVDHAHGETELCGNRRQGLGHFLAEVAIGAVIKNDLHGPENTRKEARAFGGGAACREQA